jgi:AcrR family transcriptional regulator
MARPRKPILSRRLIAEAALKMVGEEGLEALTTRRLARRLGVEGPSLYNHIASRDDLIDEVHALIAEQVDGSALENADWRQGLAELARSYRRAYIRHPQILATLLRRPVRAEVALGGYDQLLRFLMDQGWDGPTATAISAALDYLTLGSAIETFSAGFDRPPDDYANDYPSLAEALRSCDGTAIDDAGFELGLEALLSRLENLPRTSREPAPTTAAH